jgi:Flp pilus assembly protein TadD
MFLFEFRLQGADTVYRRTEKVDFIVGSGNQTRSYLLQREGYLYEMPLTWYVHRQIWDLSPGYAANNSRFERAIGEDCLACHTGGFDLQKGSQNRYTRIELGIDCERCHGPGAEHVRRVRDGQLIDVGVETDYTIVNPANLTLSRQFDICQQCHLQGVTIPQPGKTVRDFRPGMDLAAVFDVFLENVADPDAFGIASHAERLQQSACFLGSEGKMTCTTCHDPHTAVKELGQDVFNDACGTCHRTGKQPLCTEKEMLRTAQGNNCAGCHMPAGGTRDIPHVWFHDHKIRVVKALSPPVVAATEQMVRLLSGVRPDPPTGVEAQAWLAYFETQDRNPAWLARANRLAGPNEFATRARIALLEGRLEEASGLQQQALARQPDDLLVLFQQGEVLEAQGKWQEAFEVYNRLYQGNEQAVEAGFKAGVCLLKANPGNRNALEDARTRFEELLRIKPFDTRILANLGFVQLNLGQWQAAEANLAQALAYDPDYPVALENMAGLQFTKGNRVLARTYLEHLRQVRPDHPGLARLDVLFNMPAR